MHMWGGGICAYKYTKYEASMSSRVKGREANETNDA